MLVAGHVGLTIGIVRTVEVAIKKCNKKAGFKIDYRYVIVGSVLPDVIDKPLVQLMYGLTRHSGHLIAHTYGFTLGLIVFGAMWYIFRNSLRMFMLGIGSFLHLIFDKLILLPNVFLLPIFNNGRSIIPKQLGIIHHITGEVYKTIPYVEDVKGYFMQPYIYLSEIFGGIIIIYFALKLFMKRRRGHVVRRGKEI